MLSNYVYPDPESLHQTIVQHFELLYELGTCVLLFEERGELHPHGMRISPLHFYQIANDLLMDNTQKFADTLKLSKQDNYTSVHHYITWLFFRATLERAWLCQSLPILPTPVWSFLTRVDIPLPKTILSIIEEFYGLGPSFFLNFM
jgi:hypothetical protein